MEAQNLIPWTNFPDLIIGLSHGFIDTRCREEFVTVTKWSTVRVAKKSYSVPSQLIGERLNVRLFAATGELYFHDELIGPFQRLRRG